MRNQVRLEPGLLQFARRSTVSWSWSGQLWILALGCAAVFASVSLFDEWQVIVPSIAVAADVFLLLRWWREWRLLASRRIAIATIRERFHPEGPEGGKTYRVQYYFVTGEGIAYEGRSSMHRELPPEGECIPVMYRPGHPEDNLPFASFWFYRFSYDGT